MKISIVTPCYNAEKYIEPMIKSVLEQSYSDFELIIVNDGSIDNSAEIIASFDDERITLINQENSGRPSVPRNNGIKHASGEIICFLDSDDTYLPSKLQTVADAFKQYPNTAYLFHDHITCLEDLTPIVESYTHSSVNQQQFNGLFEKLKETLYQVTPVLYKFSLFVTPLIHTNAIAIRASSYPAGKITFREDVTCTEDLLLWNYLMTNGNGIYIDVPLSTYRNSLDSVTDNKAQFDLDTYSFYKENMEKYHAQFTEDEFIELKLRATKNIISASYGFFSEDPKLAIALCKEALEFHVSVNTIVFYIKTQLRSLYFKRLK